MRYAFIESNIVTNVVEWDGIAHSEESPHGMIWPDSARLVRSDTANINDTYNPMTGEFTPQAEEPQP